MGLTGLKSRCQQDCFFLDTLWKICLLAYSSFWRPPAFFGFWLLLPSSKIQLNQVLISNYSDTDILHCFSLFRTLMITLSSRESGKISLFQNLNSICNLNSPLPHHLMYSQVWRLGWKSLGVGWGWKSLFCLPFLSSSIVFI